MSLTFEMKDFSPQVLAEFEDRLEVGLDECGVEGELYAVAALEGSPRRVDTGLLKNSITHALAGQEPAKGTYTSDDGSKSGSYEGAAPSGGKSVYIGTNVDYAGYVHDGTSKMAANPFIKTAMGHGDRYKQIIERALKG